MSMTYPATRAGTQRSQPAQREWQMNRRARSVALVLAAAGLLAWLTLALAPALATEPAPDEHEARAAVIRRIQSAPAIADPEREGLARRPQGSPGTRQDQRAQELAKLRLQVAALQRSLEVLLTSVERAFQRLEPAVQTAKPAVERSVQTKNPPAAPKLTPPSSKNSSQAPSR
jgi:hypothetical protein